MIEFIKDNDSDDEQIIAIIVRGSYNDEGAKFFTPNSFSQQLGYLSRPKGYLVKPHIHNLVIREVSYTQEVLVVKSGIIKVNLFNRKKEFIKAVILNPPDLILLASGGHGIEFLEASELIEIKQGPYISPQEDKEIFS
ncbi:MAG: hypothetical protein HQK49_18160 [Oligoflexia bacterium]|nr:hypothetical protein [Oligoflexia bacterium]